LRSDRETILFPLLLIASSLPASAAETDAQAWAHSQSVDTVAGKLEQANTRKSAQTCGLTDEEWQRYQALMNGRRGVFSPDLDPITAPGIEARTVEARLSFAEL
ncbi:TIGR03759 family integrating conjugative element protein, partial [Acinetobacter baumannii]|nr:TIGR03759 family integrating conjugative element protein [Acinetobacter baumannii]